MAQSMILILASPITQAKQQFVSRRRNPNSHNITWLDASWGSAARVDWEGYDPDPSKTRWTYYGVVDGEKMHRVWDRYGPPMDFEKAMEFADPL